MAMLPRWHLQSTQLLLVERKKKDGQQRYTLSPHCGRAQLAWNLRQLPRFTQWLRAKNISLMRRPCPQWLRQAGPAVARLTGRQATKHVKHGRKLKGCCTQSRWGFRQTCLKTGKDRKIGVLQSCLLMCGSLTFPHQKCERCSCTSLWCWKGPRTDPARQNALGVETKNGFGVNTHLVSSLPWETSHWGSPERKLFLEVQSLKPCYRRKEKRDFLE